MGCISCGTTSSSSSGEVKGCNSNGCSTGGCNKLNTYDWFGNMLPPDRNESENIYEVRFKNTRKAFFQNVNGLSIITGDYVVVESDRGYDVGMISLGGVLASLQMKKRKVNPKSNKVRKIYRLAIREDVERLNKARQREQETIVRTRQIVLDLKLDMKVSDVEYQGDNTKAIFYYIADQRVDFRDLIKLLAGEFRIRVEMKQIGLRHEAGLVGGIGSCGRELCCSTWLTDFKSVSTSAARFQNLSLNPMKISGQCGRLKCCLNYELETYLDALQDIPKVEKLETEMGVAFLQKTDIFKKTMWFTYKDDSAWIPLEVAKVVQMAEMNKEGLKPASLRYIDKAEEDAEIKEVDYMDTVGQSVLRDEPRRKKKKKGDKRGGQGRGGRPQGEGHPQGQDRGQGQDHRQGQGRGPGQEAPKAQPGTADSGGGTGPRPQQERERGQDGRRGQGQGRNRPQGEKNDGNQREGRNQGNGPRRSGGGRGRGNPNQNRGANPNPQNPKPE